MSDNKKIPTSSSFLKRNFFIIVFITVLVTGGAYLYLNNKNFIQTISKADPVIEPVIEAKKINPNKDLEMKVANLERLILELSSTMQEVQTKSSEQVIVQPQKNIIEVKATNEGINPPNTSRIELIDGKTKYTVDVQLQHDKNITIEINK